MSFNAEINSIYKRNNHSEKKGKTYNMISDIKLYIIIKLILKSSSMECRERYSEVIIFTMAYCTTLSKVSP